MKKFSSTFFTIATLFIITACGGQKSATKLEIVNSALTASNSSFEGGLVVMGKSGSNTFTIPVTQSGSTNSVTIELPQGTWTFSAVAWDGSPSPFHGTILCDLQTVTLDQSQQAVNLKVTNAKCFTGNFGAAVYHNGSTFNMLRVITCGWLYEDSAASTQVGPATPINFCQSSATTPLPIMRREHAESVKVEVPKIVNGVRSSGILSMCLSSGTEGALVGSTSQLPTAGLPVRVVLFENSTCDETNPEDVRGDYFFPDGIATTVADQSSVLNSVSSSINLFLPFNPVKAGFSNFIANLPKIFCNIAHCTPDQTGLALPNSEDRIIQPGQFFVLVEEPNSGQTCSQITSVVPTGFSLSTAFNSVTDCFVDREGRIQVKLNFSGALSNKSIAVSWTDSSWDFSMNVTGELTGRLFDLLYSAVGYDPNDDEPALELKLSLPSLFRDYDESEFGILSRARAMLEVDGPAGAIYPVSCTAGFRKERTLSIRDEGTVKTFRVIFRDSERFISATEQYAGGGVVTQAGTRYNKKFILQEKKADGTFVTKETLDVVCSSPGFKLGVYEAHDERDGKQHRVAVFFNTMNPALPADSKAILYRSSEKRISGALQEYSSELISVGNLAANELRSARFHLDVSFVSGTNWRYRVLRQELVRKSGGTMSFLEVADDETLSGEANASLGSIIAVSTPVIQICSSGDFVEQIFGTVCLGHSTAFAETVNWNDLLIGGGLGSVLTPASTFRGLN